MIERHPDERGQVGIGTLIVFIAMVLVAAIAAGVLVNTAGFLQATAENTGQESVNKVTNRVDVINAHGRVATDGNGNNRIQTLNLTVRLGAGSGNVDMDNVTVKYLSDSQAATLTNGTLQGPSGSEPGAFNNGGSEFVTNVTKDADGSVGVLNTPDDRFVMKISAADIEGGTGLAPGDTVNLEITSRTGGTTTVILTMPAELAGKNTGEPVSL